MTILSPQQTANQTNLKKTHTRQDTGQRSCFQWLFWRELGRLCRPVSVRTVFLDSTSTNHCRTAGGWSRGLKARPRVVARCRGMPAAAQEALRAGAGLPRTPSSQDSHRDTVPREERPHALELPNRATKCQRREGRELVLVPFGRVLLRALGASSGGAGLRYLPGHSKGRRREVDAVESRHWAQLQKGPNKEEEETRQTEEECGAERVRGGEVRTSRGQKA